MPSNNYPIIPLHNYAIHAPHITSIVYVSLPLRRLPLLNEPAHSKYHKPNSTHSSKEDDSSDKSRTHPIPNTDIRR